VILKFSCKAGKNCKTKYHQCFLRLLFHFQMRTSYILFNFKFVDHLKFQILAIKAINHDEFSKVLFRLGIYDISDLVFSFAIL